MAGPLHSLNLRRMETERGRILDLRTRDSTAKSDKDNCSNMCNIFQALVFAKIWERETPPSERECHVVHSQRTEPLHTVRDAEEDEPILKLVCLDHETSDDLLCGASVLARMDTNSFRNLAPSPIV